MGWAQEAGKLVIVLQQLKLSIEESNSANIVNSASSYPLRGSLKPIAQIILRTIEMILSSLTWKIHLLHKTSNRLLIQVAFSLN